MGDPQMRKMLWVMVGLCACMGLATGASAVLVDTFDYGNGAFLTSNGWTAHSGAGTQPIDVYEPGLAYPGYPTSSVIGQAARLDNNGEDDWRAYAQSSGVVYYSFLVNVPVAPGTAGYFAMLNGSTSDFWARVNVASATGAVYFGISNTGTAPTSYPASFALNTTHLIVVKYDFTTGWAYLWVDPSLTPCAEPTPFQTSLTAVTGKTSWGFALRQFATNELIYLDGLRIGTTWSDVVCGAAATGACCAADGTCSVLTQVACLAASGVYRGDGTTCPPSPACPLPGTCCHLDGTCSFVFQAACSGTWTVGGVCDPNPCPQPGSCCQHSGACTVTFLADCTQAGAVWTSHGVCDPNTCALPTGACCTLGVCTVTEQLACLGETWTLDGTCFPDNPCTQPTGSCCALDGTCSVTLLVGCNAPAIWTAAGICVPNPCAQPYGSCCYPDGTCAVTLQDDCTGGERSGIWTMFGVCDPNTCVQPDGACCAPDGSCTMTKLAGCAGGTAAWTMFGVCDPNTCFQPSGRCCLLDGTCTVALHADCAGIWTALLDCPPLNPCVQPTGACCLPAGTCLLGTQADCALTSGVYQGNFTTCTPNPCPAPTKTLCEVAEDDANGLAVLVGQRVTVQGIALCDGMTWSTTIREFQITDGTCCIDVFGGTLLPAVALGDLVRVTGTVENYAGKTELSTPDMIVTVLSSGNPIPTPGVTTTGNLAAAGEPFESCLFTIYCASIVSGTWPALGLDANIVINDGSGPVTMRIDKDTNIDGSPAPTGPFTITGIGDQYDTTSPYTTGWQIKPRMLSDLTTAGCATGACCFPNGTCLIKNASACAASPGGTYAGDGTNCDPNLCPPAIGACCPPTGICVILNQADCLLVPAVWLGYGSVCEPNNPCDQPDGRCCYTDGSCMVMPELPCTGAWTMFANCDPNLCPPPPPVNGSCCLNGVCSVTTAANCAAPAVWLANGTCDPNLCPPPPAQGACCNLVIGFPACTITTQAGCVAPLVWLGADVPCDVVHCTPPNPVEKSSWGQIKNQYR